MPALNLSVPHNHDKNTAVEKLKSFSNKVRGRYGDEVSDVVESWDGSHLNFGFRTRGMKISGNIEVEDDQVKLEGTLPLAAMMFKGRIEKEVHTALRLALA
ncbi:MAG: polyhydroxyalkanoic acid system family protein [Pirellulales bacterium]